MRARSGEPRDPWRPDRHRPPVAVAGPAPIPGVIRRPASAYRPAPGTYGRRPGRRYPSPRRAAARSRVAVSGRRSGSAAGTGSGRHAGVRPGRGARAAPRVPPPTGPPVTDVATGRSRCEAVPGTPFGLVDRGGAAHLSGPAIGSLVAGIGSILVSLLVVCFGLAGAADGLGRRWWPARSPCWPGCSASAAIGAGPGRAAPDPPRRAPAAMHRPGLAMAGISCGGGRAGARRSACGRRRGAGRSCVAGCSTRSTPVRPRVCTVVEPFGPATLWLQSRIAGERRHRSAGHGPRFDLRAHGGYSFPSCLGFPGRSCVRPSPAPASARRRRAADDERAQTPACAPSRRTVGRATRPTAGVGARAEPTPDGTQARAGQQAG